MPACRLISKQVTLPPQAKIFEMRATIAAPINPSSCEAVSPGLNVLNSQLLLTVPENAPS